MEDRESMRRAVMVYRDICVGFVTAMDELLKEHPDVKKFGMCTIFYAQILDKPLATIAQGTAVDILHALAEVTHGTTETSDTDVADDCE